MTLNFNFILGSKYEVPVESGLTHEKALEILSLFVNMKIEELPKKADDIVRECKGKSFLLLFFFLIKKKLVLYHFTVSLNGCHFATSKFKFSF